MAGKGYVFVQEMQLASIPTVIINCIYMHIQHLAHSLLYQKKKASYDFLNMFVSCGVN